LRQDNYGPGTGNRVAVVPTEGPYELKEATHIGESIVDGVAQPRQLVDMMVSLEIHFAGYDQTADDDLLHMRQAVGLLEAVVQALQHSYYGAYDLSDPTLNMDKKHLRHGVELIATLTINVPLFDVVSSAAVANPKPGEPKPA
jgi:hypothetical protein